MKRLISLLLALSATSTAWAQSGSAPQGSFLIGVKTGNMHLDVDELDADTPQGIVIGYRGESFGFEIEGTSTDLEYDEFGLLYGYGFGYGYGFYALPYTYTEKADFETLALYGTFRSPGDVYFKGKIGILREEIKLAGVSETDTGLSAGIGGGVKLGLLLLEAEFTIIEQDASFLSIGATLSF